MIRIASPELSDAAEKIEQRTSGVNMVQVRWLYNRRSIIQQTDVLSGVGGKRKISDVAYYPHRVILSLLSSSVFDVS